MSSSMEHKVEFQFADGRNSRVFPLDRWKVSQPLMVSKTSHSFKQTDNKIQMMLPCNATEMHVDIIDHLLTLLSENDIEESGKIMYFNFGDDSYNFDAKLGDDYMSNEEDEGDMDDPEWDTDDDNPTLKLDNIPHKNEFWSFNWKPTPKQEECLVHFFQKCFSFEFPSPLDEIFEIGKLCITHNYQPVLLTENQLMEAFCCLVDVWQILQLLLVESFAVYKMVDCLVAFLMQYVFEVRHLELMFDKMNGVSMEQTMVELKSLATDTLTDVQRSTLSKIFKVELHEVSEEHVKQINTMQYHKQHWQNVSEKHHLIHETLTLRQIEFVHAMTEISTPAYSELEGMRQMFVKQVIHLMDNKTPDELDRRFDFTNSHAYVPFSMSST